MGAIRVMAVMTMLVLSHQASAANLWCTGTVKRMFVDNYSKIFVLGDWNSNYAMICDLDTTWNGITPELCKAWFVMLQGAYHTKSNTTIQYANTSIATCLDIPHYGAAPAPTYVLNND